MPEESKGELDLSNLDSILSDLEKDLEEANTATPQQAAPEAPPPPAAPAPSPTIPAAVTPVPAAAELEEDVTRVDELLAAPVSTAVKDDHPDEMDEMFTEEDEINPSVGIVEQDMTEEIEAPKVPVKAPVEVPPARPPEPALASATASAPAEEISFEDALELDAAPTPPSEVRAPDPAPASADISFEDALELEEPPAPPKLPEPAPAAAAVLPPPLKPAPKSELPAPTLADFQSALKKRDFAAAVQIGAAIRPANASIVFRQNLAGALFYAGRRADAEKELAAILQESPYTVSARRNLEFVRSR